MFYKAVEYSPIFKKTRAVSFHRNMTVKNMMYL